MPTRYLFSKVPGITIYFWIIKVLTTGLGESTSDYLVHTIDPIFAVLLGGIGLVIALLLQFKARCYVPWIYWLSVLMVAVFGTMAADVLHIGLGIPYLVSTIFFAVSLAIIFALWYAVEKTLSIHSIHTHRRELFYWATIMATFALGTATGDLTAVTLKWGYFYSGVLFTILIILVTITYFFAKGVSAARSNQQYKDAVLTFWLAYILTRPLGASFADWMGKAHSFGGLGWGDGIVSLGLFVLIVIFVSYLTITRKDIEKIPTTRPI